MSIAADLTACYEHIKRTSPPEVFATFDSAGKTFEASFDSRKAIKAGDTLPKFSLPSATGAEVSRDSLLARGPLLISFYRGGWCPFCNIELRALQKNLPKFQAAGVTLVGISPELPDQSLSRTQKMGLEFMVLSDVGNELARRLGIVFPQPDSMRPILESLEADWKTRESLDVPVPAMLLVDERGVVRQTFVNPDYSKRLGSRLSSYSGTSLLTSTEPTTALKWIEDLKKTQPSKGQLANGTPRWGLR